MDKKKAKFFCENCGEEVAKDARFCKKCGRFFAAVRCPKCFKVGTTNTFKNGCPVCGYAGKESVTEENKSSTKRHFYFHKRYPVKSNAPHGNRQNYKAPSLPLWIYLTTFGLFVVTAVIVFQYCRI